MIQLEQKSRLEFIDLHRGIVLLVMIEVHVFNAFMLPELKQTGWFALLNFVNGLVAPSFLFISGFAFILSSKKRLEEFRKYGKEFFRRLGRILLIILAGYSLHLPFYSLSQTVHKSTEQQMLHFFAVDVLQCIGVSLLVLYLLRIFIRNEKFFTGLTGTLAFVIPLVSPFLWKTDTSSFLHPAAGAYINTQFTSLFPLFPWAGFLFLGAWLAIIYSEYRAQNREDRFMGLLRNISLIIIAVCTLIYYKLIPLPFALPKPDFFFYLLRSGLIVLFFYICSLGGSYHALLPRMVILFGMESLLVYWLHLQVIYRKIGGINLNTTFGKSFGITETIAATIALSLLMLGAAFGWNYLKKKYAGRFSYVFSSAIALLIIIYLLT